MTPRRYRSTTNINLPFKLQTHVVEPTRSRVEYTIHLRANFDSKLNANNVVLRIPTPLNTTMANCKVQMGKAKYVPEENVIVWKWVVRSSSLVRGAKLDALQDSAHTRRTGGDAHGGSGSRIHDGTASVVAATHQPRLLRWVRGNVCRRHCS